jgi:hypothetical protein
MEIELISTLEEIKKLSLSFKENIPGSAIT